MAPLAVYGVQDALSLWALADKPGAYRDFFPLMNASWVYMELVTIAAAALALRFFPFPFILFDRLRRAVVPVDGPAAAHPARTRASGTPTGTSAGTSRSSSAWR